MTTSAAETPTGPLLLPAACAAATAARTDAVLEQVMRCCDDELAVLSFVDVPAGTAAAAAALGRLLCDYPGLRLVAGCPLMAFVTDGPMEPDWQRAYPPAADSLYAQLEFLEAMYGPAVSTQPQDALEELRARAETDLGSPA
jgi:hypothetical protein